MFSRALTVFVGFALVCMAGVYPSQSAVEAPPLVAATQAEGDVELTADQAIVEAQATGESVEVTALRDETTTVTADPSGTLTAELSSVPERVMQDGGWVPVDSTLEKVDGVVRPVASDVDIDFAANDSDVLVSMETDAQVGWDLDWPGPLPEPTLAGNTATYTEVLPGVDLLMSAVPGGYTQILKVKTAAAGKNPALNQLRFPTEMDGVGEVTPSGSGGFVVDDVEGDVALVSNEPVMWDSSG